MENLHDIIPEILIFKPYSYRLKFHKNEVHGYIYVCNFSDEITSILEGLSEIMSRYEGSIIALAPMYTIPSIRVLALATLYTYNVLHKRKKKIHNRALLLLSIIFAKRQLIDTINIINKYINKKSKLIITCHRECIEDLLNDLKDILVYCRKCQEKDWRLSARFKEVYDIEPSIDLEVNEKIIITKITRHYLSIL
ncbi:MAG: hypothetical protein DRO40_07775 [Thermoprotei archaeon]|nr:MAG: hypothetical protein DRO40_07775 [Thermoprotei archaeon]